MAELHVAPYLKALETRIAELELAIAGLGSGEQLSQNYIFVDQNGNATGALPGGVVMQRGEVVNNFGPPLSPPGVIVGSLSWYQTVSTLLNLTGRIDVYHLNNKVPFPATNSYFTRVRAMTSEATINQLSSEVSPTIFVDGFGNKHASVTVTATGDGPSGIPGTTATRTLIDDQGSSDFARFAVQIDRQFYAAYCLSGGGAVGRIGVSACARTGVGQYELTHITVPTGRQMVAMATPIVGGASSAQAIALTQTTTRVQTLDAAGAPLDSDVQFIGVG